MIGSLHDIPGTHYGYAHIPDQAAGDATNYLAAWVAPFACTITGIDYIPTDNIAGANTNTRHLNVDNSAGTEIANKDFTSGNNGTGGAAVALTLTSTAADLNLAEGGTLRFESELVGTGLALPAGCFVIKFKAR